jgi:hypothetical protein
MNDYEEQLLAGMPELTEEQRQKILLEQQQVQSQLEQLEQTGFYGTGYGRTHCRRPDDRL